jgi:hypothetical protein
MTGKNANMVQADLFLHFSWLCRQEQQQSPCSVCKKLALSALKKGFTNGFNHCRYGVGDLDLALLDKLFELPIVQFPPPSVVSCWCGGEFRCQGIL